MSISFRKKVQTYIRPTSKLGLLLYNFYYNLISFHKKLYLYYPKNDYYIGKLLRYGKKSLRFHLSCKSAITFIYELYIKNLYLKDFPINKGEIVLDIGANAGLFSVLASEKVGDTGKVICFEPSKDNIKNIKKNFKLNNIKNSIIIPKGTYSYKKDFEFYIHKEDFCNSIYQFDENKDKIIKKTNIQTDTVENLLKEKDINLKDIKFIKIDNEGAELETLKGMKNILENSNLRILIPDLKKTDKIYNPIVKLLKEKGFKIKNKELPRIFAVKVI